jgi:hypothetical protein
MLTRSRAFWSRRRRPPRPAPSSRPTSSSSRSRARPRRGGRRTTSPAGASKYTAYVAENENRRVFARERRHSQRRRRTDSCRTRGAPRRGAPRRPSTAARILPPPAARPPAARRPNGAPHARTALLVFEQRCPLELPGRLERLGLPAQVVAPGREAPASALLPRAVPLLKAHETRALRLAVSITRARARASCEARALRLLGLIPELCS